MSDYKPKKKPKREWCEGGGKFVDYLNKEEIKKKEKSQRKKKYARCSVCDQRFEVYNRDSCCDIMSVIPPHKAY